MPFSNYIGSSAIAQPGVVTSTTRPASPYEGQVIYETDTNRVLVWDASAWLQIPVLDSGGRLLIQNQVAFQAKGPVNAAAPGTNPVIFSKVDLNIGNGYSTTTGRFTAPVAGTYFVTWSFLTANANDTYRFYLRKNGNQIGDLHLRMDTTATGSEFSTNAHRNWIISLNVGDYLTISFNSDGNSFYNSSGDEYSSFAGYLIG